MPNPPLEGDGFELSVPRERAIDLSFRLSSMFLKLFVFCRQIYGRDRAGGSCRVVPERQTVALPPEAAVIRRARRSRHVSDAPMARAILNISSSLISARPERS